MNKVWKSWWWENDYSYDGQYPVDWSQIPHRIRLSNGNTKTDKTTFTLEELVDAGYKVVKPLKLDDFNEETHQLGYNNEDGYFIASIEPFIPEGHTEPVEDL